MLTQYIFFSFLFILFEPISPWLFNCSLSHSINGFAGCHASLRQLLSLVRCSLFTCFRCFIQINLKCLPLAVYMFLCGYLYISLHSLAQHCTHSFSSSPFDSKICIDCSEARWKCCYFMWCIRLTTNRSSLDAQSGQWWVSFSLRYFIIVKCNVICNIIIIIFFFFLSFFVIYTLLK